MSSSASPPTQSPAAARRFCVERLRSLLADQPERVDLIDDVALIVSELITNTINAAGTTALLGLSWHRGYLRISVDDDAPGVPALQTATRDETHGRVWRSPRRFLTLGGSKRHIVTRASRSGPRSSSPRR